MRPNPSKEIEKLNKYFKKRNKYSKEQKDLNNSIQKLVEYQKSKEEEDRK